MLSVLEALHGFTRDMVVRAYGPDAQHLGKSHEAAVSPTDEACAGHEDVGSKILGYVVQLSHRGQAGGRDGPAGKFFMSGVFTQVTSTLLFCFVTNLANLDISFAH